MWWIPMIVIAGLGWALFGVLGLALFGLLGFFLVAAVQAAVL